MLLPHEKHAIAFLLRHIAWGGAGALILGALVLAANVGGLRTLAFARADGWLYLAILFFGLFVTCGSIAAGLAVMGLGKYDPRS